jgi:hypothetical protein
MKKILDVLLLSYFIIEQLGNKVHYMTPLLIYANTVLRCSRRKIHRYVAAPVISFPPVACPPPLPDRRKQYKTKKLQSPQDPFDSLFILFRDV